MRRRNHNANRLAIQLLAPQSRKEANAEHNRVQGTSPRTGHINVSIYGMEGPEEYLQCPEACGSILEKDVRRLGVLVGQGLDGVYR